MLFFSHNRLEQQNMTKITLPEKRQVGHLTLLRQGRKISLNEYNALTIDEQLSMVHNTKGKEKYDLLINSKYVEKIVPQLHPQELYLTVNSLGTEYSLELLSLASARQITLLLDLDCWDGDTLSPILSLAWLEILLGTGEEKVCELVRELEPEILTLFLKKHLIITRGLEAYDDDDAENAKRLESLYDVQYASENAAKVIGAILKIWQDREQENYLLIMEMIRSENLSVLEEEVYQIRNNRLLDLGIVPASEARAIYSYINPDTFKPGGKPDFRLEAEDVQLPAALIACAEPQNLLAEIISGGVDHETGCELLFLANRRMSADNIDLADDQDVAETFQSTYDILNLALEFLAGKDLETAKQIFRNTYLLQLFQLGHSLLKRCQQQAQDIASGRLYPYFDYHDQLFIDSLLQNPAVLSLNETAEQPAGLQKITTREQLEQAQSKLKQMSALEALFTSVLPFDLPAHEYEDGDHPTLSGVFLTAVANQLLERGFSPVPLVKDDLPLLRDKTFTDGTLSESFKENIHSSMAQYSVECRFFAEFCLDSWEQIFTSLNETSTEATFHGELLVTIK
jgi:hypothetical protein